MQDHSPVPLPGSKGIMVLGFLSVLGFVYVGIVLALLTLLLASRARRRLEAEPGKYSIDSANRIAISRMAAIIGLILGGIFLFYSFAHFFLFGTLYLL